MSPRLSSAAALAFLLVALLAPRAVAEAVKLRSGRTLQVDAVRIGDRVVSITMRTGGGTATLDLHFERIDPRNLLDLLDRHTVSVDPVARLRSARLALEFGLRAEAAVRFHQAAELDPDLGPERNAGLAALRALEAADAFVTLETRLRSGSDALAALTLATALLEGPYRDSLSPAQVLRIRTLAGLARSRVARERSRAAAAAAKPATPAPIPPPAPSPPAALPAVLAARVNAELVKARHAREAAAKPKLDIRRVRRYLDVAARALLAGRRLLRESPAAAAAMAAAVGEFHRLLVSTYLDLADLNRQEARFDEARAHVRAALILDPGNEEAWEQRRLIEEDLRRDPFEPYGLERRRALDFYTWYPGYGYGSYYPSRWRGYGTYYRRTGVVFRFGHPAHQHGARGSRRTVGTRRAP